MSFLNDIWWEEEWGISMHGSHRIVTEIYSLLCQKLL
ncbi:hypothetical protein [Bartonella quintana]